MITDPTRRFSNRVENYIKYRPGYPAAILEALAAECGLRPDHRVADIGCGTGILAELFLGNGNRVIGVEPNREMRESAERRLGGHPRFTSLAGTAEDTGLGEASVDFVTAGQAFHWFDRERARREFGRILRPGGWVVLAWNERRDDASTFMADYEALLLRRAIDYERVGRHDFDPTSLRGALGLDAFAERTFEHGQILDRQGLVGRLLSSSYVPERGDPGYPQMMEEVAELFQRHQRNDRVTFEYACRVFFGRT